MDPCGMSREQRLRETRRKDPGIHRMEAELLRQTGIPWERFHRVRWDRWEDIYRQITARFADKTRARNNGLHWANTNGYSPWAMERLLGCYQAGGNPWYLRLPEILPEESGMVWLLLDLGGDWHSGEHFYLFEGYVAELTVVLRLLDQTAFLGWGYPDYYLVSKKLRWIIGFNHHDVVSLAGEGPCLRPFGEN